MSTKFKGCCQKSLDEIDKILTNGKWLSYAVPSAFMMTLFGPNKHSSQTLAAVPMGEYAAFAQAMAAIPSATRSAAFKICQCEELNHIKHNDPKLRSFWKGMGEGFA